MGGHQAPSLVVLCATFALHLSHIYRPPPHIPLPPLPSLSPPVHPSSPYLPVTTTVLVSMLTGAAPPSGTSPILDKLKYIGVQCFGAVGCISPPPQVPLLTFLLPTVDTLIYPMCCNLFASTSAIGPTCGGTPPGFVQYMGSSPTSLSQKIVLT